MTAVFTSNVTTPEPTLDEMLAGIEGMLKSTRPIGHLYGVPVMLNGWDRTLSIGATTCSVDHPYLAGTAIRTAALEAMGEKTTSADDSLRKG